MSILILSKALNDVNCAAGRMFAEQCGIEYPVDFCLDLIRVFAPTMQAAKRIFKEKKKQLADSCLEWEQSYVELFWIGHNYPIVIPATAPIRSPIKDAKRKNAMTNSLSATISRPSGIVIPEMGITVEDMEANESPVWIIDQLTQNTVYANPAACAANKRPKADLENKEISALWEEEKLQDLTRLVFRDRRVSDHTNIGFRWDWEETEFGPMLVRVRHEFNVDYHLFSQQMPNGETRPLRYELVKNAVPVRPVLI